MSVEFRFLIVSLVLIVGLILAYYLLRRISLRDPKGPFGHGPIRVLWRYPLGNNSYLLMVGLPHVVLVLGVTSYEIRVLYEISDEERIEEIEETTQKQGLFTGQRRGGSM
ncbi:MAG: flagellar biosynthetic protein FliO [Desulfatiglandales bacterium]